MGCVSSKDCPLVTAWAVQSLSRSLTRHFLAAGAEQAVAAAKRETATAKQDAAREIAAAKQEAANAKQEAADAKREAAREIAAVKQVAANAKPEAASSKLKCPLVITWAVQTLSLSLTG